MKKTNIYHVIWDNNESWAEDHNERHVIIDANSEKEAIDNSYLEKKRGSITAELVFKDVLIPEQ